VAERLKDDDRYSEEEIARRRDEAIRRALNTPHKPVKEFVGKSVRPPAGHRSLAASAASGENLTDGTRHDAPLQAEHRR